MFIQQVNVEPICVLRVPGSRYVTVLLSVWIELDEYELKKEASNIWFASVLSEQNLLHVCSVQSV